MKSPATPVEGLQALGALFDAHESRIRRAFVALGAGELVAFVTLSAVQKAITHAIRLAALAEAAGPSPEGPPP